MAGKDVEFIKPPSSLKDKVSIDPNGIDPAMLEKAEQLIAGLQGDYLSWVQEDLTRIQAAYEKARDDKDNRDAHLEALFQISHDMKGQGGSFNYPLMTQIGNLLCRFLEKQPRPLGSAEMDVVKVHIDTMRIVISKKMEGDGGQMGDQLMRGLQAVLAKVSK